jgi:hypothetical protein
MMRIIGGVFFGTRSHEIFASRKENFQSKYVRSAQRNEYIHVAGILPGSSNEGGWWRGTLVINIDAGIVRRLSLHFAAAPWAKLPLD